MTTTLWSRIGNRLSRSWRRIREPVLDRPIFLVGCAKSGTTALGLLMLAHPHLGPKIPQMNRYGSLQEFLNAALSDSVFDAAARSMEQKALWNSFFPMHGVELTMGKELILFDNPLSHKQQSELVSELTKDLHEARFFTKQPFNTYRIHALREMFPDAKIIGIHRDGRDVISSWGRRGKRWERLGGYAACIDMMAVKWADAVNHIEKYKAALDIYTLKFESLVKHASLELAKVCEFCELPYPPQLYDGVTLENRTGVWKTRIPAEFHRQLQERTFAARKRLGYLDANER